MQMDLIKAAKTGDIARVRELLAQSPALLHSHELDGSTALHYAAWKGHLSLVEELLNAGADVNARNTNSHWGTTPLHAAAHANQAAICKVIVEHGA